MDAQEEIIKHLVCLLAETDEQQQQPKKLGKGQRTE